MVLLYHIAAQKMRPSLTGHKVVIHRPVEPFSIVCAYPILSDARGKHRMFNIKEKYSIWFQCSMNFLEDKFYIFNIVQCQI